MWNCGTSFSAAPDHGSHPAIWVVKIRENLMKLTKFT